jgi:hypothetical protein
MPAISLIVVEIVDADSLLRHIGRDDSHSATTVSQLLAQTTSELKKDPVSHHR